MQGYELLLNFFRGIGAEREAEMYFRLFRKTEPKRFAVVEIEDDLSPFSLDILALNLAFLSALDLYPVVVHSCAPHMESFPTLFPMEDAGSPVQGKWSDRRVREGTIALNESLVSIVILHEGDAAGIVEGVFERRSEGIAARTAEITRTIRRKAIPIVAALAGEKKRLHPISRRRAVAALVRRLRPTKYIRISEKGGILRSDGAPIDYVNLKLSWEKLLKKDLLDAEARRDLEEAATLLADLPIRSVLQVTSASNLLRELFTQKGGGTLVKLGRDLQIHGDFSELSRSRLRGLIERAFQKKLVRDYFVGRFSRRYPVETVIVDPDYRGLAVVRGIDGLAYLDKFAVTPTARGEGIAADLWTVMTERHASFFWRSRRKNPINPWYYEKADGMVKRDEWIIWWKGLNNAQARRAVRIAESLQPTVV